MQIFKVSENTCKTAGWIHLKSKSSAVSKENENLFVCGFVEQSHKSL